MRAFDDKAAKSRGRVLWGVKLNYRGIYLLLNSYFFTTNFPNFPKIYKGIIRNPIFFPNKSGTIKLKIYTPVGTRPDSFIDGQSISICMNGNKLFATCCMTRAVLLSGWTVLSDSMNSSLTTIFLLTYRAPGRSRDTLRSSSSSSPGGL